VEEVLSIFISLYLSALAGMDPGTARAVFSGVTIHDGISFIKRIAEVRNSSLSTELDDVLSQLLIISDVRNLILHHSVSEKRRKGRPIRIISNIGRALTAERKPGAP